MFEAQYLFGNNTVYSPWMSRSGDNMVVTVDLIAVNGTGMDVTIEVYQKNSEQTGDGFAFPNEGPGSLTPETVVEDTAGQQESGTFSGVMELVRYKITAGGTGSDYVLFRMLPIVWFDDVKA